MNSAENKNRLYYYRPLLNNESVLKCAGFGAEKPEHRAFFEKHFTENADATFAAGAPVISTYQGDRISA